MGCVLTGEAGWTSLCPDLGCCGRLCRWCPAQGLLGTGVQEANFCSESGSGWGGGWRVAKAVWRTAATGVGEGEARHLPLNQGH